MAPCLVFDTRDHICGFAFRLAVFGYEGYARRCVSPRPECAPVPFLAGLTESFLTFRPALLSVFCSTQEPTRTKFQL